MYNGTRVDNSPLGSGSLVFLLKKLRIDIYKQYMYTINIRIFVFKCVVKVCVKVSV